MRIAIVGATSQIAKDLIESFSRHADHELVLFARSPAAVSDWLLKVHLNTHHHVVSHIDSFGGDQQFDAILNFVGVGNPAQAKAMGASIFDVTHQYDELALNYVKQHPHCRYLFLSSGAAYGSAFNEPANRQTRASVPINNLQPQDWYSVAKLYAECRHRSLPELPVIDIRVFNYFGSTQDLDARFLICDIIRAIQHKQILTTSSDFIVRDYLHPADFFQLVQSLLNAPLRNAAVDCYSLAPVSKIDLLNAMQGQFGLQFDVTDSQTAINATGNKPYYYSENTIASEFGYVPSYSSLTGIAANMKIILAQQ